MPGRAGMFGVVGYRRIGDVAEVTRGAGLACALAGLGLILAGVALNWTGAPLRTMIAGGAIHRGAHIGCFGTEEATGAWPCRRSETRARAIEASDTRCAVGLDFVAGPV